MRWRGGLGNRQAATMLVAAPGNPGIARWADCVAIDPCDPAAVVDAGRGRTPST